MTNLHTLVVRDDYGDGDLTYRIVCHGVTDARRTWVEADCPEARVRDEWDGDTWFGWRDETIAHGVKHAYVDGAWQHPTRDCWLATYPDLPSAVADLDLLRPGRYGVRHEYECGGEGAFTLDLVAAVTR